MISVYTKRKKKYDGKTKRNFFLRFKLNVILCVSGKLSGAVLFLWGQTSTVQTIITQLQMSSTPKKKKEEEKNTSFIFPLTAKPFLLAATDVNRPFYYGCLMLLWQPA